MSSDSAPQVAFVLSGGGSLGAVEVGMLLALWERGITPAELIERAHDETARWLVHDRPRDDPAAMLALHSH